MLCIMILVSSQLAVSHTASFAVPCIPDSDFKYTCPLNLTKNLCDNSESSDCNGICDAQENWWIKTSCQDEVSCGEVMYGLYCTVYDTIELDSYKLVDIRVPAEGYLHPSYICDNVTHCLGNDKDKDEMNCEPTTDFSCVHSRSNQLVRIPDFVRCAAIVSEYQKNQKVPNTFPYCKNWMDQTNCTSVDKIALTCLINGHSSTVSAHKVCVGTPVCDDSLDVSCFTVSPACRVPLHKHQLCDGVFDCPYTRADEEDIICKHVTKEVCKRKLGGKELPIPISWLLDGVGDCENGRDERDVWPKCGVGNTERYVAGNSSCQNVMLCDSEGPAGIPFIEYSDMCDGVNSCGNENTVCFIYN